MIKSFRVNQHRPAFGFRSRRLNHALQATQQVKCAYSVAAVRQKRPLSLRADFRNQL
jgi:hypothetical protein